MSDTNESGIYFGGFSDWDDAVEDMAVTLGIPLAVAERHLSEVMVWAALPAANLEPSELQITDADIDAISRKVGFHPSAWDCANQHELIRTIVSHFRSAASAEPVAWLTKLRGAGAALMRPSHITCFEGDKGAFPVYASPQRDGWKLVPLEPAEEMLIAGRNEPLVGENDEDAPEDYRAVYKAMLAAAPSDKP